MKKINSMEELKELLWNNKVENARNKSLYWTVDQLMIDISYMITRDRLSKFNKEVTDSTYVLNVIKNKEYKYYRDVYEIEELIDRFVDSFSYSNYHVDNIDLADEIKKIINGKMYSIENKKEIVEQYDFKDLYDKIMGGNYEENN